MSEHVIEINDLYFKYNETSDWLLKDLELSVEKGEFIAIRGPSGVGKSTLLNLIALLAKPDKGEIRLIGQDVTNFTESEATVWRRQNLGFVFQQFHLLPHLTVVENIQLPLALNQMDLAPPQLTEILHTLDINDLCHKYPRHLSGGQMQRVAIARAMIHQPSILLADEPTGNLDEELSDEVLKLMVRQIKLRLVSTLMVTHSDAAASYADKVYYFENHHLVLA
ncbi:MAG TPA: ABC transporter ATP-binding protein [Gammaproteobacteria bacterium]|nr:ABC transporter ATP-binding protein [Gammaproteobacteria bacterium]